MHVTALAHVLRAQAGVISYRQLIANGWSRHQIEHARRRGWLIALHDGVYAVGHTALRDEGRCHAALLACAPLDARAAPPVLSHRSACALWRLGVDLGQVLHVTGTGSAQGGKGVQAHRSALLRRHHRTVLHGVPITTLPKTVLDVASQLELPELVRVAATAHREKGMRPDALRAVLDEHPRARGRRNVRLLLDDGLFLTRSEFERRFLAYVREQGWPRPLVNRHVTGHRADFHWPDRRLIVEADGFAFHRDRLAFEDDHDRDLDWQTARWDVRRITWRQLTKTPTKVRRALTPFFP